MRLLVTGGCGFIGSNFVRYWAEKYPEDRIKVFDKLTYAGRRENLAPLLEEKRVRLTVGDICTPWQVRRAMKDADVVVHFAAESHVDRSVLDPQRFERTNEWGTINILQEAKRQGVRLVHHVSTDEVFGELPLNEPELKFTEDTPYSPHSPYAVSKANADNWVRTFHHTYGLPVTISNTSNNYGPYQFPEKLIPLFITNLIEGKKVPLMGNGENVRDWCYVGDHCRAIDVIIHAALEDKSVIGKTYCVGGEAERTNLQVTQEILRLLGKDESWIEHVPHRQSHDTRYAIDSSKISRELGWRPEYDLEIWFEKTVKWYCEHKEWWEPLKETAPDLSTRKQLGLRYKEK